MMRKNRMIKGVLLIAVIGFSFVISAFAQKNAGPFKELREEIKAYAQKNIIPDMAKWKSTLDNAMSKEDLAALNDLRAKAASDKKEIRNVMGSAMKEKRRNGQVNRDSVKAETKGVRSDMKNLAIQLKPIAEKYKTTLLGIQKQAEPKIPAWKKDIMDIVDKWKSTHQAEIAMIKEKTGGKFDENNLMKRWLGDFGMNKKRMAARFMLWNGNSID